ncbi:MAG: FtsX-like permease family protein [Gammaproteobacteria bacterium]|nr:FtsX-like permease family protein [Gammaproteobacteria bacterium]MYC52301.1 FtsX-like permease family protein [Gammaproteobacteria bacterium]
MYIWEGVRLALGYIRSEKLKSFFSLLGVIVGIMFLIVVVSIVEGMDRYIREDFATMAFGVNTVTLQRVPNIVAESDPEVRQAIFRRPRIEMDDADAIRTRLETPATIAIRSDASGEVAGPGGRKVENVLIVGTSSELFAIRSWEMERGRAFSPLEAEHGAAVVVLGKSTADLLFEDMDPIGRQVRIHGFPYRVIGVIEEQGSMLGFSRDNIAVAPALSPLRRMVNPRGIIDEVMIQTESLELLREAQVEAEGIMRARRGLRPREVNNFELETAEQTLSFWDNISRILFVAFPGLVSISLVVGGIVIMNIMLVSVMERTREIGVRKAIGARRKDIVLQVLIETATLSGVGALAGIGIGIVLTMIVRAASPLPAAVAPHWIALGVALGVTVGVLAGVYPASRAAKLDPVDALRYE